MKDKNCILRITQQEDDVFKFKAALLGLDKSKLFRNGAVAYWGSSENYDPTQLFESYTKGTGEEKEVIVELLFRFFRLNGYPHKKMSNDDLVKEMEKLVNTPDVLLPENHLQTNIVGLPIANFFHPDMVKVRCLNYKSPDDLFQNDDDLRSAINRWFVLGNKPSLAGIRRILKTRDGVQSVVNFKPAVARYFYQNYCPENGKTLDPCAGYGGRLTGLISCNKNILYHGIDPCPETMVGNQSLAGFYGSVFNEEKKLKWKFRYRSDLGCCEDVMLTLSSNEYDFIFSSPPYFSTEKYSNLPNQSYLRYPEYDEWKNGFLKPLVYESARVCKVNGYVGLNVKNYKRYPIADDLEEIAKSSGLILHKRYEMRLANKEFHRQADKPKFHTEPIFIFKKQ